MSAPALLLVPGEDWPAFAATLDASAEPWPVEVARVDLVWWLAVYGCADIVALCQRWRRGEGWVRERLQEQQVRARGSWAFEVRPDAKEAFEEARERHQYPRWTRRPR